LTEFPDLQPFHYDTYIPDPPYIRLTISHLEISKFSSPAHDDHERGFTMAQEASDWAATSRFFNPHRLLPTMKSLKFKGERKIHNKFLGYFDSLIASPESRKHLDVHAIQDEDLALFGKHSTTQ